VRTLACTALLLAACGPLGATSVIDDAEVALVRAHASDADKYAPYDATAGDLYLAKAREEQGHARYASAIELARKAQRHADEATRKAAERRLNQTPASLPKTTIQRPEGRK
jgi:hypothetical protein